MHIHKNIILTRSFPVYGWIADNINLYGLLTLANDAIDLTHLNVATTYTRDVKWSTSKFTQQDLSLIGYGAFYYLPTTNGGMNTVIDNYLNYNGNDIATFRDALWLRSKNETPSSFNRGDYIQHGVNSVGGMNLNETAGIGYINDYKFATFLEMVYLELKK